MNEILLILVCVVFCFVFFFVYTLNITYVANILLLKFYQKIPM